MLCSKVTKKAEIFYKNNYNDSNLKNEDKRDKCKSLSLSLLDNLIYNKVINNKRKTEIIRIIEF